MEDVTVTALYLDYGGGYRNLRVLKFTELYAWKVYN